MLGNKKRRSQRSRLVWKRTHQGTFRSFLVQFTFFLIFFFISFLLTFAYAEALEAKKELEEVHALYDKFLATLRANLEQLEGSSGNTSVSSNGSQITNGNADGGSSSQNSSFNTQSGEEPQQKKTELQTHRTEYGLAWIMYMRFGMRAEGVKPSRTIFAKARKDRWTPWQVYEAAGMSCPPLSLRVVSGFFLTVFFSVLALMEYHRSDGKVVASRIFERGLDVFGDEIEYVVRYLGFLISINDENSTFSAPFFPFYSFANY